MTANEQNAINKIHSLLNEIRTENQKFRNDVTEQVNALASRVDQKHTPIILEKEIVNAVQNGIAKAIGEALSGYNSPLTKYATNVVSRYQQSIESTFDAVVSEGIKSEEFRLRVREVLLQKIAKTVTSGIDGSIDKTVNLMKQDAIFRSRLTLAVNGLVNDFLNQQK